ncbi:protocatechuate 3,4-dioxygenase subunit alpha [Paroceanicella profunda]|uniref:Protocatechuate 3,4-dioxygenase subunit alpha n=1 Tax=Paroceanicella profunda TaxID=2579971 RepID=A0A5B8FVG5_9RHOB|nr:protocatechuate 3,4-dioxygenase subunit alpha [Paroceanicella profunda]QDL90479.1 protocatechuate 3,4-dioxygenase subunit alpha [Paroceanicella profunda]
MQGLDQLKETASQTAGPYVHIGCVPNFCDITGVFPEDLGCRMVNAHTKGERITVRGRVFDGTGTPLRDALIEIWQADAEGLYPGPQEKRGMADPNFTGFGRSPGDMTTGEYVFETVRPGTVPFPDGRPMAPHITFWVVARGINIGLHTRMYFPDDEEALKADPILMRIEHQVRVATLIAQKTGEAEYTFDIHLQGPKETIFFDI